MHKIKNYMRHLLAGLRRGFVVLAVFLLFGPFLGDFCNVGLGALLVFLSSLAVFSHLVYSYWIVKYKPALNPRTRLILYSLVYSAFTTTTWMAVLFILVSVLWA